RSADFCKGDCAAVVEAGLLHQIHDPALVTRFGMSTPPMSSAAYRKHVEMRIEATNYALSNIPEDRTRYHTCWGSWHTPHTTDLPFRHVIDLMLKIKAQAYSVEAADARHQLDWKLWEEVKFPEGKIYIPGVVAHKTTTIEPPELVADRILTYARIMGREWDVKTSSPAPIAGTETVSTQTSVGQRCGPWPQAPSWRVNSSGRGAPESHRRKSAWRRAASP